MKIQNVVLIGMPGCGKSTVGVLLAKRLGFGFVDTDLLIQQSAQFTLQEIIDTQGYLALRQLEEKALLSLAPVQQVIATGGSAVYSKRGLAHLKRLGTVIYLKSDLISLAQRLGDYSRRGIASDGEQRFEDIYAERCPLYEAAADSIIDCIGLTTDEVVDKLVSILQG